ncbi:hypothetical protein OAK49_02875 [Euryarchaeota archaeon]|nr:hypothetical protein [Euryarchaeota archaeon]
MFGADTFHTAMAEIVVGTMVLATVCAVGCASIRYIPVPADKRESLMVTMDKASMAGASMALLFMPIAIMSGNFAAENTVGNDLLYNKFVYSGLALGFWAAFVVGRVRMGPGLWEVRPLAILQSSTAVMAFLMTTMASSIGGKLVRGESLFDVLPIWFPSDSAVVLPIWASAALLVVGMAALFVVFRMSPRTERIQLE